jgi:hypothetical protein
MGVTNAAFRKDPIPREAWTTPLMYEPHLEAWFDMRARMVAMTDDEIVAEVNEGTRKMRRGWTHETRIARDLTEATA